MSVDTTSDSGIGFVGLLTIAFIVLKLTHFINWSWWWVLAPIWATAALVLLMLAILAIVVTISE